MRKFSPAAGDVFFEPRISFHPRKPRHLGRDIEQRQLSGGSDLVAFVYRHYDIISQKLTELKTAKPRVPAV
jgi:hypothetical protein